MAGVFARTSNRRPSDPALRFVLVAGAVAGILAATVGPFPMLGRLSGVTLVIAMAITKMRRALASDGAEQMAVLTLFAACLAVLPNPNQRIVELAVWFVAGQLILCYATSGVAKALSPVWRKGEALALIMGSESYGHPTLSAFLKSHTRVAKALTKSVMVFECLFLVVLWVPREVTFGLLAMGFGLHLACAVTMGLNAFLLAFPGSYLCLAYVAQRTSALW
jgi:hypothetical protein